MLEELGQVSAADLRNALIYEQEHTGGSDAIARVSEFPKEHFDADGPTKLIWFEVMGGTLIVTSTLFTDWPGSGVESEAIDRIRRLVEPLVRHGHASVNSVAVSDWWSGPTHLAIDVRVEAPWRGKSVADLYQLGESVGRLMEAFDAGDIARESVGNLVRGGGAHLLIDQPEGNWLDAKSEEYDLTTTRGKIRLAQSVARFANAEDGGLIVIGAKAKKVPGGEVIREVRGVVPRQNDTAARYGRVLDQHLYPPVFGIRVDLTSTADGRALILVDVPPQPEELKPFLVHGAITADGETEGSFISIVQRRGEGSIPITAPMIHASIAAGRALLRGGSAPPS